MAGCGLRVSVLGALLPLLPQGHLSFLVPNVEYSVKGNLGFTVAEEEPALPNTLDLRDLHSCSITWRSSMGVGKLILRRVPAASQYAGQKSPQRMLAHG